MGTQHLKRHDGARKRFIPAGANQRVLGHRGRMPGNSEETNLFNHSADFYRKVCPKWADKPIQIQVVEVDAKHGADGGNPHFDDGNCNIPGADTLNWVAVVDKRTSQFISNAGGGFKIWKENVTLEDLEDGEEPPEIIPPNGPPIGFSSTRRLHCAEALDPTHPNFAFLRRLSVQAFPVRTVHRLEAETTSSQAAHGPVKCGTYVFLLFSDRPKSKSNSDPCRSDGYYHARIDKWVGPSEAEVTWCGAKTEKSTEPGVGEMHYGFRWVVCQDQNPLVHDKCGDRLTVDEINRGSSYVKLADVPSQHLHLP